MLVITSKEFRANQKSYLDQVDAGQELLVQRGKDRSYKIVPVTECDTIISKEYLLEPDADFERTISFDEFKNGALSHIRKLHNQQDK